VRGRGGRTHAGSPAAAIADLLAGLDSAEMLAAEAVAVVGLRSSAVVVAFPSTAICTCSRTLQLASRSVSDVLRVLYGTKLVRNRWCKRP
jgi:hypothetical protein